MANEIIRRILWADDEIDLLKPHIRFLEQKGYAVTPVPSGGEALAALERERYDVLLIDEMMPGMGGLETLDALKQKDVNVPVILVTKSEEETAQEPGDRTGDPPPPHQAGEPVAGLPRVQAGVRRAEAPGFATRPRLRGRDAALAEPRSPPARLARLDRSRGGRRALGRGT